MRGEKSIMTQKLILFSGKENIKAQEMGGSFNSKEKAWIQRGIEFMIF